MEYHKGDIIKFDRSLIDNDNLLNEGREFDWALVIDFPVDRSQGYIAIFPGDDFIGNTSTKVVNPIFSGHWYWISESEQRFHLATEQEIEEMPIERTRLLHIQVTPRPIVVRRRRLLEELK